MPKTDETHQLIRSLNKNEKRVFKLSSRVTGGDKNYLKVFDALDAMPIYDRKTLNKNFSSSGLNISYEKNYLQSGILKMLRNNPAEGALLQSALLLFSEGEVLFSKGLYKLSLDKIERAKSIAGRFEFFGLYMDLLNAERRVYLQSNEVKSVERLREWDKEFLEALERQDNLYRYIALNNELHILGRSKGAMLNKKALTHFKRIVTGRLMKNDSNAKSVTAKLYYYQHKLSYFSLAGNAKEALGFSKLLCDHFNESMLIEKNPQNYITALINHVIFLTELKRYNEADVWIRKLENFPASHKIKLQPYIMSWKFQMTACQRMDLFVQTGKFQEALSSIPTIKKEMQQYLSGFSEYYSVVYQYYFAIIYFGTHNYTEAIREFQNIVSSNDNAIAKDHKTYAKILLLLCHYERGNADILPYMYKQLKLSSLNRIEKKIVDLIMTDPKEKMEFVGFLKDYKKDPGHNSVEQYFNLFAWLDSKIEGIFFAEAIKRRLK